MARQHQIGIFALLSTAITGVLGFANAGSITEAPLAPAQKLQVNPLLTDAKEAENISGAACALLKEGSSSCLLIGDEKRYARFFALKDGQLAPGDQLFLLPKDYKEGGSDREFDETDAEGIAYSSGSYFLIGSHGLNKSGDRQPSRYFIYRVSVDPKTGMTADLGSKYKPSAQVERSANLKAIIHGDPELSEHEADIPGRNGVNIEGLAVTGDTMYVGFRGPLLDGKAVIAALSVSEAFGNENAKLEKYLVDLGPGQGIRDIAAVEGGFLVLSGPEKDMSGPAAICFWKPGLDAKPCRGLVKAGPDESKPEALTLVETTKDQYKVLIMSDGADDGAPAIYDVPR